MVIGLGPPPSNQAISVAVRIGATTVARVGGFVKNSAFVLRSFRLCENFRAMLPAYLAVAVFGGRITSTAKVIAVLPGINNLSLYIAHLCLPLGCGVAYGEIIAKCEYKAIAKC